MRHHTNMNLSSTEVALAASAITAASGWLIAARTSYLNSGRDHTARLWEREAKVYEYMLSRVEYWAELRRNAMFAMSRSDTDIAGPDPIEFEEDHRFVKARLDLFGEQIVHDAFDYASMEGMQFIGNFTRYRTCQKEKDEIISMGGEVTSATQSVLSKARNGLVMANKSATAAQDELITAAHKTINRLPRLQRDRIWKRWLPRSRSRIITNHLRSREPELDQAAGLELTTTVDHNDIGLQPMESDGGKPCSQVNHSSQQGPAAPSRHPHTQ